MYKSIVVGTDGSDTAGIAVHHAVGLAKLCGATLHIVHAYQPIAMSAAVMSAGTGGSVVDYERLNESMAGAAQSVCDDVTATAASQGVNVEAHAVAGDPCDALIGIANAVDADLLVVGNRGMTGMKRFMLGSVPNRISHHAPCTLLIVDTTH